MNFSDILKTISQMKPVMWLLLITFALSTVVSGCATEYFMNPERFWAADTSKVILVAFCLTLPFWAVNSLMTWTLIQRGNNKKRSFPIIMLKRALSCNNVKKHWS